MCCTGDLAVMVNVLHWRCACDCAVLLANVLCEYCGGGSGVWWMLRVYLYDVCYSSAYDLPSGSCQTVVSVFLLFLFLPVIMMDSIFSWLSYVLACSVLCCFVMSSFVSSYYLNCDGICPVLPVLYLFIYLSVVVAVFFFYLLIYLYVYLWMCLLHLYSF